MTEINMSINSDHLRNIVQPLITWYAENARELPWRRDTEPYKVWVSEIMLQQTRVEAVIPYFESFISRLPHVFSLAKAPEELLLKLWEGLGYYSRVRNMQKCAQAIVTQYGGVFPSDPEVLQTLPGIGLYTAGAIASISFEQPTPAVDGNVLRVVARITGDPSDISNAKTKVHITKVLKEIYPAERRGDFTQSLMELGATVCTPLNWQCENCPVQFCCVAYARGAQGELPVKQPKKARKREEKTVLLLRFEDKIAVRRREEALLKGLFEFPHVEGQLNKGEVLKVLQDWGIGVQEIKATKSCKHIFTHVEWSMLCYEVNCSEVMDAFLWVTDSCLTQEIPLPVAFKKCL